MVVCPPRIAGGLGSKGSGHLTRPMPDGPGMSTWDVLCFEVLQDRTPVDPELDRQVVDRGTSLVGIGEIIDFVRIRV